MQFYNQSITRMVATAFMDFFSRVSIEKFKTISVSGDDFFAQRKIIPVPIQWATREKWVEIVRSSSSRKAMDPSIHNQNPVEMQWILPRISCNLNSTTYDASRRLIKTQVVPDYANTTANTKGKTYTPTPYNLEFEICTIARHLDDNLQIMEQILPYFSPTMNLSLNLYDGKETESIPITLNSVSMDNPTDIPENDERIFTNVYSFTVKINYYMMKKIQGFITTISVNMQNGDQIVKIDKTWLEAQQKIQTKFTEYVANAGRTNPLVNVHLTSALPNYTDQIKIDAFINAQEEALVSAALSGMTVPSVENVVEAVSGVPTLVYLTSSAASSYQNNFNIYYRINDDMTIYKYEGPITVTETMDDIYCWSEFSTGTTVSQLEIIRVQLRGFAIGSSVIVDINNPSMYDFVIY